MKIYKYLLYVLFVLALTYAAIYLGFGHLSIYWQVQSLLFTLIGWLIPTIFLVGVKETMEHYQRAFSSQKLLAVNQSYFRGMSIYLVSLGMAGLLIGIINMMTNLESREQIGENLAFALLSLLYNLVWALIVSIPFWAFGKSAEQKADS
jgi:flagellar motor component MotA